MKYNPKINEDMAALPGFTEIHPLQPTHTVQGCLEVIKESENLLCEMCIRDRYAGDQKIGHTTSGTHCPYLGYPIAMALVDAGSVAIGDKVEADVRGRRVEAEVVQLPFYKRAK